MSEGKSSGDTASGETKTNDGSIPTLTPAQAFAAKLTVRTHGGAAERMGKFGLQARMVATGSDGKEYIIYLPIRVRANGERYGLGAVLMDGKLTLPLSLGVERKLLETPTPKGETIAYAWMLNGAGRPKAG